VYDQQPKEDYDSQNLIRKKLNAFENIQCRIDDIKIINYYYYSKTPGGLKLNSTLLNLAVGCDCGMHTTINLSTYILLPPLNVRAKSFKNMLTCHDLERDSTILHPDLSENKYL
jgi:hypothetical protein